MRGVPLLAFLLGVTVLLSLGLLLILGALGGMGGGVRTLTVVDPETGETLMRVRGEWHLLDRTPRVLQVKAPRKGIGVYRLLTNTDAPIQAEKGVSWVAFVSGGRVFQVVPLGEDGKIYPQWAYRLVLVGGKDLPPLREGVFLR